VLTGFGRADVFARVYWIEMLPYMGVAVLLIYSFGIWGAAMSWSLREICNAFLFMYYSKKHTGLSVNILKQIRGFVPGILVLLPVTLFALFYNNYSLWLMALVPISFSAYIYMVWKKIMIREEKVWVIASVQNFLKKLKTKSIQ
jgi:O-antigen/teichoic acid export membrane protein